MEWNKRLFFGKKASNNKIKLIKSINKRSFIPFLYIICIIDSKLCIVNQFIFNIFYNKKRSFIDKILKNKEKNNILIVGFAITKYEAFELVRDIVDEVYIKEHNFEYEQYLRKKYNK